MGAAPISCRWRLAVAGPLAAVIATAAAVAAGVPAHAVAAASTDDWRPAYHFSPARHWINDPNGLVYLDGEYHLFFQYNPFGDEWGHMSWGHAVSRDLIHWTELPVAIAEDEKQSIFSGSIVVDEHNSSAFGAPGQAPLVAVYTGASRAGEKNQSQQLAYSLDRGRTWTKYASNPVLDLKLREFRDPKVFWYEPDQRWVMVAVLSLEHKVAFFGSGNLKTWNRLGDFGPAGATDGAWECPDLFALPVSNVPKEVRWVLKVDVFRSKVTGGSGAQYFVGGFDGRRFVEEAGDEAHAVDYGRDFYAAASWEHLPARGGRQLWIAWMSNHDYAKDVPTSPWRGEMTLPRDVTLRRVSGGYELAQSPVAETIALRVKQRQWSRVAVPAAEGGLTLEANVGAPLEILATLERGSASEFGLRLRAGSGEETVVGYDVEGQRVFVDRTKSGRVDFNAAFPGRQFAPLALVGGALTLHLMLDRSSLEVFAGDGTRVFTEQIFPRSARVDLVAYAHGGTAGVRSADLWDLAVGGLR